MSLSRLKQWQISYFIIKKIIYIWPTKTIVSVLWSNVKTTIALKLSSAASYRLKKTSFWVFYQCRKLCLQRFSWGLVVLKCICKLVEEDKLKYEIASAHETCLFYFFCWPYWELTLFYFFKKAMRISVYFFAFLLLKHCECYILNCLSRETRNDHFVMAQYRSIRDYSANPTWLNVPYVLKKTIRDHSAKNFMKKFM